MTNSLKLSKIKLTTAEIAVVSSLLDGFESSGFASLYNLAPKTARYINKFGLRYEVLLAFAQSAVIDYPNYFGPIALSRVRYEFMLYVLQNRFYDDARVTYHEGNGSLEDFSITLAYDKIDCPTNWDFVFNRNMPDVIMWTLNGEPIGVVVSGSLGSSISSLKTSA